MHSHHVDDFPVRLPYSDPSQPAEVCNGVLNSLLSAAERAARNLPDAKTVYDMLPDSVTSRIRSVVRKYV